MDGALGRVKDETFVKEKLSSFLSQGKIQSLNNPSKKAHKKMPIDSIDNREILH